LMVIATSREVPDNVLADLRSKPGIIEVTSLRA